MKTTIISSLFAVIFLFSGPFAYAEKLNLVLSRTSTSGLQLEGSLSKDMYKSVPYQDTYEEQEAYQAEETYYVDIPYQEEETYYVDVPYQETETYYEDVPYQVTEPYQDTEYYTENEYKCRTVTEYERECRNERVCAPKPGEQVCRMVEECGVNARGERICKQRKVCETGPSREECSTKQVCNSVPKTREQCGYEQVRKSRTVTKYRTVTRYRQELRTRTVTKYRSEPRTHTVTKYRQEARTRTVTKYRTVTKCCDTKYRSEYSHTWHLNVQIVLPNQATLFANETEQFEITMKGTEAQPDVDIQVIDSIYGYKLAKKDVKGPNARLELALTPKYNQQTLGEKLLHKVELSGNDDLLNELIIHDKGLRPRVKTLYRYRVLEKGTASAVLEGEASSEIAKAGAISVMLAQGLSADVDYVVQISASRSGVVLEKPFSFSVTKEISFQRWSEADFGEKTVIGAQLKEKNGSASVEFTDEGAHAKLVTQYRVIVLTQDNQTVWSNTVNATDVLNSQKKAKIEIPQTALEKEEDLMIALQVQRSGRRLEKPVQFQILLKRAFVSTEDLKDSKKIHSLDLVGLKSNMRLVFSDDLVKSAKVKTEYRLLILRHSGFLGLKKTVFIDLRFDDSKLRDGGLNELLTSFGAKSKDLNDYAGSNRTLYAELIITRKLADSNTTVSTIKKYKTVETE